MGLIREPKDIDFEVISKPLTQEDRKQISDIISHYRKTGEVKRIVKKEKKRAPKTKVSA